MALCLRNLTLRPSGRESAHNNFRNSFGKKMHIVFQVSMNRFVCNDSERAPVCLLSMSPIPITRALRTGARSTVGISAPRENSRGGRNVVCSASYKVKLMTPDGEFEFDAPDDAYLLDTAEENGVDLPYSCRSGNCASCAGKILGGGEVDQSEGTMLSDEQIESGYLLICIAKPLSDLVIETHQEREIMG